ncbi:HAD family hydrolase [Actinomadura sp. GTD37]|uniref:HAD family hydrolase n=1 Tax=Actinomadura sp. GTD37 TaxID=1778030 RepID=UPI0035BED9C2
MAIRNSAAEAASTAVANRLHPRSRGAGRRVVASSEAGSAKPDAGIFRTACAGLGVLPDEAAYVGDRLVTDAQGAVAAGLAGIWLDRSGGPVPEDLAVPRITTLEALPRLLGER